MSLTIAYMTNRKEPHLRWFVESLANELAAMGWRGGGFPECKIEHIIAISPHDFPAVQLADVRCPGQDFQTCFPFSASVLRPKPCIWQGPHRIMPDDWFAAGNARNTALCYTRTDWILYVDDLSVMLPGYLKAVLEGMQHPDTITAGCYQKVRKLVVEAGVVKSFEDWEPGKGPDKDHPHPPGFDNREAHLIKTRPGFRPSAVECDGNWIYGCSLLAPVEALLTINGWCEDLCGGLGFEDCLTGIVLRRAGYKIRYDTRMKTYESDEDHFKEQSLKKADKGVSPNDKSHAALSAAQKLKRFDNGFDLRQIRNAVLVGGPRAFPIPTGPTIDWYDGKPLVEMKG